jgi:hypothetical protein
VRYNGHVFTIQVSFMVNVCRVGVSKKTREPEPEPKNRETGVPVTVPV